MWANSVWGLLGFSGSSVYAMLGLPPDSALQLPLRFSAVIFFLMSLSVLCWPLRHPDQRTIVSAKLQHPTKWMVELLEPSHIIILGLALALGGAIWQWRRVDPKISDLQSQLHAMRSHMAANPNQTKADKDAASAEEPKNPLLKNVAGPPIEWRFDKPATIFMYSRKPGDAVRIEAIVINGTNTSDFALKDVSALLTADMKSSQLFTMRVNPHGVYLEPDKSAGVIPPRAKFDLTMSVDPYGMTAEDFLKQYGSLRFSFSYQNNGMPVKFNEQFLYSYLEDQIAFIEEKTRKGM
jgi:hypothetical protein